MVVLPKFPGLQITIVHSDGTPFKEYDDDEAEPSVTAVSKYIEAVSGAEFGIRWEVSQPWPPYTLLLDFEVDQRWTGGNYCSKSEYNGLNIHGTHSGTRSVVNGRTYLHKFAFAALDIDGNAPLLSSLSRDLDGMGEITVEAFYVKDSHRDDRTGNDLNDRFRTMGKIPEKALKGTALSHQTTLRVGVPIEATMMSECDFIDPNKQPFAIYTFKYRSRDVLKSLMIIPRSPSPVPLEDRELDTLSPDEMRELLGRQRERDAAAQVIKLERGVKRERDDGSDDEVNDTQTRVAAGRRRDNYRISLNANGVEEIDFT